MSRELTIEEKNSTDYSKWTKLEGQVDLWTENGNTVFYINPDKTIVHRIEEDMFWEFSFEETLDDFDRQVTECINFYDGDEKDKDFIKTLKQDRETIRDC